MTRDESTVLIHAYAEDYTRYKLDLMTDSSIISKPPVNPVIKIIGPLQQQIDYWKLRFQKQVEASRD